MNKIFDLNSPIMVFLSTLADVIVLNLVAIVCCIPVITIGPVITAVHYTTMKMVKNESGYIVKTFFKSFKENFKQSFLVWMVFLVITIIYIIDFKILQTAGLGENQMFTMVAGILAVIYVFICMVIMYIFPLMSYFVNTVRQTVKNAMIMCILHLGKTISMALIYALPIVLVLLHLKMLPVIIVLGISGPAYINCYIWRGIFKKYEPVVEIEEENVEENEDIGIINMIEE